MKIEVTTKFNKDKIIQSTEIEYVKHEARQQLSTKVIELQTQGIKDALIKLGWTPPKEEK